MSFYFQYSKQQVFLFTICFDEINSFQICKLTITNYCRIKSLEQRGTSSRFAHSSNYFKSFRSSLPLFLSHHHIISVMISNYFLQTQSSLSLNLPGLAATSKAVRHITTYSQASQNYLFIPRDDHFNDSPHKKLTAFLVPLLLSSFSGEIDKF